MRSKEFLQQLVKLDMMIENKLIERDQWKSIAMGTTSGGADVMINGVAHKMDKVQSSGNPQKMADAVAKYVDLEAEIDTVIDELIETKKDVIAVIEMLTPIEYNILHKVYVQRMELDEVAALCNKTYSWVTTIHGRALKNVQKILDEREKP
jgi:DNA-directed RNA polymerase specialized sigma subunit